MKPFANEPVLELRRAPVRAKLEEALREHDSRPPLKVPVWIGDDRREGE
jgi:RHH-type proline utilization regulon transcriptional repressor/proline dehydrogenase/delta 1-pyrroline-5-carboxylate dehydrogenase